jgi:dihydroorotate dehydrogenase (fumarate)/dihydropyrimidine dehydrogenase (NAD+) subunit PreA
MIDLSVEICGFTFKNPLIVAAGTPTKNAKYMKKAMEAGAGGVVAKTITREPLLQKYPKPRFTILHKKGWPYIYSNYSCEYFSTYKPEDWVKEINEARRFANEHGCILIGSVAGRTPEEWAELAQMVVQAGADMVELDMGCPHPKGLAHKTGGEVGQDPELAASITKLVKEAVDVPVFVKLTPEAVDVTLVAKKVEKAGADGVTAINRYPALDIDVETGRPLLHSSFAGVGGPWMLPITLKWIAKLASTIKIPILATNGITSWKDAVKCIMCGASAVQICTAIMYGAKGYSVIGDIISGVKSYMERKGYSRIDEFKGKTLSQIVPFESVDRETKVWAIVAKQKCNGCSLCVNWCFSDAITIIKLGNKSYAKIDAKKCEGCGLCVSLCPQSAIEMEGARVYLGDETKN